MSTFIDSTSPSSLTTAILGDSIRAAFANCGYSTPYDDYTASGTRNLVYEQVFDSSKAFGKVYVRITITSTLVVQQTICTAWNTSTKAATLASSASSSVTFSASQAITFRSCILNDAKLVLMYQGTLSKFLGWMKPATLNEIDENSFCGACQFQSSTTNVLFLTGATPYGSGGSASQLSITTIALTLANHYNKRDLVPGLLITSAAGRGVYGITSTDFALAAVSGLAVNELVGDYRIISPSLGLVVK
jgi:hypothetical protein